MKYPNFLKIGNLMYFKISVSDSKATPKYISGCGYAGLFLNQGIFTLEEIKATYPDIKEYHDLDLIPRSS